ncbi:hypothetical protein NDU88_004021 [Pleurodeles waltl]|uniref:Uncharacterized protein n=1 Tax=Pleurodeles waltl TaxID=8319 RepID=A0AAV7WSV2_PLEWA|nr:hypothetical protein NDU88_004021 [Pleurodeles waltl]
MASPHGPSPRDSISEVVLPLCPDIRGGPRHPAQAVGVGRGGFLSKGANVILVLCPLLRPLGIRYVLAGCLQIPQHGWHLQDPPPCRENVRGAPGEGEPCTPLQHSRSQSPAATALTPGIFFQLQQHSVPEPLDSSPGFGVAGLPLARSKAGDEVLSAQAALNPTQRCERLSAAYRVGPVAI